MDNINIDKMTDNERYEFLIRTIVLNKEVWLLHATEGMYAMLEDAEDKQYIPVWPDKVSAEKYAGDDWEDYKADRMGIGEYLEWLTELNEDNILIAAFPLPDKPVIPMVPKKFREHVEKELSTKK